jgi:hypothetical protein
MEIIFGKITKVIPARAPIHIAEKRICRYGGSQREQSPSPQHKKGEGNTSFTLL